MGESFRFQLNNGKTRFVQLKSQRLLVRSEYDYAVEAEVLIDGHLLKLTRWFASSKQFTPPEVVNGMRIALEIASAGDGHFSYPLEEIAYWYGLEKDARFLVNDLTLPLWPGIRPMWDDLDLQITADQIGYRTHTFFGRRDHGHGSGAMGCLHADIDIAFPVGTPHYAPFDGTVCVIQNTAHIRLLSRPLGSAGKKYWLGMGHTLVEKGPKKVGDPVQPGEKVVLSGNKGTGSIPHTGFSFGEDDGSIAPFHLNLWWLMWQGFENERVRRKLTRAVMGPLSPVRVGAEVVFSSKGSAAAKGGGSLIYHWDFGDGTISSEKNPKHSYGGPGIYQICLTVSDRKGTHAVSQYITVDGPDKSPPQLRKVIYPAQSGEELRKLLLVFSERVEKGNGPWGSENPGNYRLKDGPAIESAKILTNQSTVCLYVKQDFRELREYRLTVSNIRDLAGNPIKPGTAAYFHVAKRMVLHPVADAETYDHKDYANKNFGSAPKISLRAGRGRFNPWPNWGNNRFGYLGFDVPVKKVTAASLRLFVSDRSPNEFYVVPLKDNRWEEAKITSRNAPDLYRPKPLGAIQGRPGGWHQLDVTDYVRKHLAANRNGFLSFGLRAVANDAPVICVDTREGRNPPQLIIQYMR